MSYERGMAALNLEKPDEIPHTQYITHPEWIAHLQKKMNRPGVSAPQLLDFDYAWSVDAPPTPRGRYTDMGHAVWQADGSDFRPSHESPFADPEEIFAIDPFEEYGRIDVKEQTEKYQQFADAARQNDWVTSGGTYKTVVSYAIAAFGWENLLTAAGADPERFGELLNRYTDYLMQFIDAWAATDVDVYLTHDDMVWTQGAISHPDFYRTYVFPNFKRAWDKIRDSGKKVLFCSDGDFTMFLDDLDKAGAQGFIFEPLTSLEETVRKFGKTHVIMGNADCRIMTFGTPEAVRAEVKRCMDLGRDCPGYFFAVGNHIPPNVPIENADACMEAYWDLRRR